MAEHSDYIVYVDESGDHGLVSIDSQYPVFVLAFCIFSKEEYRLVASPALQRLKFRHFGHDMVVLHERDIRKATGPFKLLVDGARRERFLQDLNELMESMPLTLVASVIQKERLKKRYNSPPNPYHIALAFGLERVGLQLADLIARPIGRKTMSPGEPNRAFDIIRTKPYSNGGRIRGFGLKVFP